MNTENLPTQRNSRKKPYSSISATRFMSLYLNQSQDQVVKWSYTLIYNITIYTSHHNCGFVILLALI